MQNLIKIQKISNHLEFKKTLLYLIENYPSIKWTSNNLDKTLNYNVSKTDWEDDKPKDYINIYLKNINKYFYNYDFIKSSVIKVHNVWFHQYNKNDFHDWHLHGGCHFASIYYLELKNKDYETEFYDYENNKIIKFNIEEGDLIIFPAFIPHRSPKILDDNRKTIIAANFSFDNLKNTYYNF